MSADPAGGPQQRQQQTPDALVRLGGWLFTRRTWLPLPMAVALLIIPAGGVSSYAMPMGTALVVAGEWLRLWAVRHIGVVSRTRSDRLGPLVATGPFTYVRNPLYLGNVALWLGFTIGAGLAWLAPAVVILLGAAYHAVVRWEESLLEARLGDRYRVYARNVPRWIPSPRVASAPPLSPSVSGGTFSWSDTFFSERGTLIALAGGLALLWFKN